MISLYNTSHYAAIKVIRITNKDIFETDFRALWLRIQLPTLGVFNHP